MPQLQLRSAASEELINCCFPLPDNDNSNQTVPVDEELKRTKGRVIQLQAALDQATCVCRDAQKQATQSTAALHAERQAHEATKQAGLCIRLDYGELLASCERHEDETAGLSARLCATQQALAAAQADLAEEKAARAAAAAAAQEVQQVLQAALNKPMITVQFTIACSGPASNTNDGGVSSSIALAGSSPDATTNVTPGLGIKIIEMATEAKQGAADGNNSPPSPGTPACRSNPSGFSSARLLLSLVSPMENDEVMAAAKACKSHGNDAPSNCTHQRRTPGSKGVARLVSRARAAKSNARPAARMVCKSGSSSTLRRIASVFRRSSSSSSSSNDVDRQKSSSNNSSPFFSRSSSSGGGQFSSSASRGAVSQASFAAAAAAGCVPSLRSIWRSQRA